MSNIIYVDNAATTPVSKPVFDAMAPYFCEQYGNPSSIFYSVGAAAGDALAAAREKVARALGCDTGEVFSRAAAPRPTTGPSRARRTNLQSRAKST